MTRYDQDLTRGFKPEAVTLPCGDCEHRDLGVHKTTSGLAFVLTCSKYRDGQGMSKQTNGYILADCAEKHHPIHVDLSNCPCPDCVEDRHREMLEPVPDTQRGIERAEGEGMVTKIPSRDLTPEEARQITLAVAQMRTHDHARCRCVVHPLNDEPAIKRRINAQHHLYGAPVVGCECETCNAFRQLSCPGVKQVLEALYDQALKTAEDVSAYPHFYPEL